MEKFSMIKKGYWREASPGQEGMVVNIRPIAGLLPQGRRKNVKGKRVGGDPGLEGRRWGTARQKIGRWNVDGGRW
jgi:hypothetical protein